MPYVKSETRKRFEIMAENWPDLDFFHARFAGAALALLTDEQIEIAMAAVELCRARDRQTTERLRFGNN